ncbi:MAG: helix-turn-helix domain-containing protein [Burkholderiaceae bacterium]|nr:helix-turn-helix domain-containing protein [Burkholderiaceae bacterium]MBY0454736.1 helix-turn-helix domain-containing protein [Burkholderiaceae bacterium]
MNFSSLFERLRDARKQLGKNQDEMAASCGVSREMWGKYERGVAVPGGEVLAKIALEGADVLYILTGQRNPAMPAIDPAEQVLLDSYRRCGPEAKQNLIQTAALLSAGLGSSAMATPAPSSKPRTRSAAGGRGSIRIDGTVHGHVVQGDVVQHGPVSMAHR